MVFIAHGFRHAEPTGPHTLLQHARLREQRIMSAFPDHVTIRLVTEHRHIASTNQIRDIAEILLRRHAARGIVRRIQKDRARGRVVVQKVLTI